MGQPDPADAFRLDLAGFLGVTLLVAGLVLSNGLPLMGHDSLPWLASLKPASLGKSLGVLLAGWAVHRLIQPFRAQLRLPDVERFDDLIGGMGIMGAAIVVMLLW